MLGRVYKQVNAAAGVYATRAKRYTPPARGGPWGKRWRARGDGVNERSDFRSNVRDLFRHTLKAKVK
jgi:hypothetical protein